LILGKWSVRFIGILSTIILVRILTPDDFGIAAQAMMVIMFFQAISHTGADQYIIKLKSVSSEDLFSAWTLNLLMKTFSVVIVFLCSDLVAELIGEVRLSNVLKVACLSSVIGCFMSPNIIILKKELNFKNISNLDIFAKVITFIFTIALAYSLKSYWALVWGNIVSITILVIGSYIIAPIKPQFTIAKIKEQWRFSQSIFFMTILGYLRAKIDIFIVSQKFGSVSTGYYSLAQEFAQLPYTEIVEPIAQPLYSSLARDTSNVELLGMKVHKYLSIVYFILVPCIIGMILLVDDIVQLVFGSQWGEMSPILANLAILMIVFATNGAFKYIFILTSRFKGVILLDVFGIVLMLSAVYIDEINSSYIFSEYRVFIGVLIFTLSLIITKFSLKIKIFPAIVSLILPLLASTVMFYILLIFRVNSIGFDTLFLNIVFMMFIGFIVYFTIWLFLTYLLRGKHFIWSFNYSFVVNILEGAKQKISRSR